MIDCPHDPPCRTFARWQCCYRTAIEKLVNDGEIDPVKAREHLAKYGLPMSPPKAKVYRGEIATKKTEKLW